MDFQHLTIALLLISTVVFSGCTGRENAIMNIAKNSPEIQQFLDEHPDAQMKIVYIDNDVIPDLITGIREDCGPQMKLQAYYKVELTSSDLDLISWIDEENQRAVCTTLISKREPIKTEDKQEDTSTRNSICDNIPQYVQYKCQGFSSTYLQHELSKSQFSITLSKLYPTIIDKITINEINLLDVNQTQNIEKIGEYSSTIKSSTISGKFQNSYVTGPYNLNIKLFSGTELIDSGSCNGYLMPEECLNPVDNSEKIENNCQGFQTFTYQDHSVQYGGPSTISLDLVNGPRAIVITSITWGGKTLSNLSGTTTPLAGKRFVVTGDVELGIPTEIYNNMVVTIRYDVTGGIAGNVDRAACFGKISGMPIMVT